MKIRIAGLRSGRNVIQDIIDPAELGIDPAIFQSPISAETTAEKSGGRVTLSITSRAEGTFVCDRCGEDFIGLCEGLADLVFIQRDEPFPDEQPGDDLRSFSPFHEYFDVSTDVRDSLILSLPMKMLCKDDCRGLCSRCGTNLNHTACSCLPAVNSTGENPMALPPGS